MGLSRKWKRSLTTEPSQTDYTFVPRAGRRARLRLLALLSATVVFAAGVLFVKYQMEGVRARVEQAASERTGSNLTLGRVRVTGLRGVEVEELHARYSTGTGASVQLYAPSALLYVDVADLFYGRINIQQVRIDGAQLEVVRDPQGAWLGSGVEESPQADGAVSAPADDAAPIAPAEGDGGEAAQAPGEFPDADAPGEGATPPATASPTSETVPAEVPSVSPAGPDTAGVGAIVETAALAPPGKDPAEGIFAAIDSFLPRFPFRLVGQDCHATIKNVVGDTTLTISELRLDLFRLSDSPEVSGSISGILGEDGAKRVDLRARYASREDFDIRISHDEVTPEDVNVFLPAEQHFFQQGLLRPQVRLSGFPNNALVLSLEVPYQALSIRDQPEFLPPQTGRLSAFAQYDLSTSTLRVTAARAESAEFAGELGGSISFAGEKPELNLTLRADRLPVKDLLNGFLAEQAGRFGVADLQLNTPYDVSLALTGPTDAPAFAARAELDSGQLRLEPDSPLLPRGSIRLGRVDITWDTATNAPRGCIVLQDGTLEHKQAGVKAEQLNGTICLDDTAVTLAPFTMLLRGNPISGNARYDLNSKTARFDVNGTVSNLEASPLHNVIPELMIAGAAGVRVTGTAGAKGIAADISVDATQADVQLEWWLWKKPGTGAVFHGVHVDYQPRKKVEILGGLTLDGSEIDAQVSLAWVKSKFVLDKIRAKSDLVHIGTLDRCLRIPYRASGGAIKGATFVWDREPSMDKAQRFTIDGTIDEVSLVANTTEVPVIAREAHVRFNQESLKESKNNLLIAAKDIRLPSFDEEWLIPLESAAPPELVSKFAGTKRNTWGYSFAAEKLELPPWKATNFEGHANSDNAMFNMDSFKGKVGDGSLQGEFSIRTEDRMSHLKASWQNIPSEMLLQHLELPPMLSGPTTGKVDYTLDLDDPASLKGAGDFEVLNGKFSADYLAAQLQGSLTGDVSALPPSLAFSRLGSDVEMQGDKITSRRLYLESEGLRIDGNGFYIVNGDMDYNIQVALTPQTAARIPALNTYFNIEGHRLTQSELALGFRVSGPSFRPRSAVAGLPPVGVTLVSGAFEMTSDALSIVDLPRQLLVDLFKIGGGIVGAQRDNPGARKN